MTQTLKQHRILVNVSNKNYPISVTEWDKFSGGDVSHPITKQRRSAGAKKEAQAGEPETDNITTEAFIVPAQHQGFIAALRQGQSFPGTTISLTYLDNAGVPIGSPDVYYDCVIAKATPPQADANSEDDAKLVIEWAVGG